MKQLLTIFLSLLLFNFLSAQNNNLSFKDKIEENDQFKAMVKNALLVNGVSSSKGFKHSKSYILDRYQYEMEWDTASSSWDTVAKYTYYSNQIAAGVVEFSGYVTYFVQNSILRKDSVYMKVDSNLNVFKIPFNFFGDYVSVFARFSIDTTTNQYRKYSEDSITSNSIGNISRASYNFHNWNPGQPTSISRRFIYDYYYTGNGPVNYYIARVKNFFGSGYSKDSLSVSANSSYYPLVVTEYEKGSFNYNPKTKYLYTYNLNQDKIRSIYQYYENDLDSFLTYTENRMTFVNGLLQSDSSFFSSGVLSDLNRYYYNSNNLLDSIVRMSFYYNLPFFIDTNVSWNRYEYDTLNRITLLTRLYPVTGNALRGNRTWFVYPPMSTSLQEVGESQNEISIFPNPTNDKIIIEGEFSENRLQIRNVTGKLLKEIDNLSPSEVIRLEDLSPGVYFLYFESGETKKLIKQ